MRMKSNVALGQFNPGFDHSIFAVKSYGRHSALLINFMNKDNIDCNKILTREKTSKELISSNIYRDEVLRTNTSEKKIVNLSQCLRLGVLCYNG
jgi:hypothetical protein